MNLMKKKILSLIPFAIAAIFVLTHLIQTWTIPSTITLDGEITSYSIIDSVFYASIGLVVTFVLILFKQEYWKFIFLGLILLSFTSVIQFYNYTFTVSCGSLNIELTALGLLILHLVLNPDIIPSIKTKLKPSEETLKKRDELKVAHTESMIKKFVQKFESKSQEELEGIVSKNELIPEALEAAKRLLNNE